MTFRLIIGKDKPIWTAYLFLTAGIILVELALIVSLACGKVMLFWGAAFLTFLVLIILNNLDIGLCLLPIVLGTSLTLVPGSRIHMAELVIVLIFLSMIAHVSIGTERSLWVFPQKGPIVLFLFASVISLSYAHHLGAAITHVIKLFIAFILVFGLVYNRVKNDRVLAKASMGLILAGLVASIYGLGQYFSASTSGAAFESARIFGRAGGLYGGVVGLSLVFLCSYLLFARRGLEKVLVCILIIPALSALVLSHIRAWYLGFLITLAFMGLFKAHQKKRSKPLIIFAVMALVTILLFSSFWEELTLVAFEFLFARGLDLPSWGNVLAIGMSMDYSLMARINIWSFAWKQFLKYPLTGVGVANFRISDPFRPRLSKPGEGHAYADNHYINILVETGILGAVAWIWLLSNLFGSCRRLLRISRNSQLEWISVGLVASLLLFLVGGIFWCLTPLLNEACITAFLFSLIFAAERVMVAEKVPVSQISRSPGS